MSTTHRVPVCKSFNAHPGDGVQWIDIPPSGCTVSQDPGSPWPFNLSSPIHLPSPATVLINPKLPFGRYCFVVSCCPKAGVCITVT